MHAKREIWAGDSAALRLIAYLGIYRPWAVPNQAQGVLNLRDMASVVGDEGVERLLALLAHPDLH